MLMNGKLPEPIRYEKPKKKNHSTKLVNIYFHKPSTLKSPVHPSREFAMTTPSDHFVATYHRSKVHKNVLALCPLPIINLERPLDYNCLKSVICCTNLSMGASVDGSRRSAATLAALMGVLGFISRFPPQRQRLDHFNQMFCLF